MPCQDLVSGGRGVKAHLFERSSASTAIPVAAVCLLWLILQTSPASSQTFRVDKVSLCTNALSDWSSPCMEVSPPYEGLDRNNFANNRVYVKLAIACEDRALSFLKSNGFLPVYVAVWKDGTRKPDIPVGIAEVDWDRNSNSWISSSAQDGKFVWATFFYVGLFDFKSIELQIVDAQKVLVYVGAAPARAELRF